MPKLPDYICPKCKYSTPLKVRIKKHFFKTKYSCTDRTGIELTEEIKQHVLEQRQYSRPTTTTVNQSIHQYNTYNAIINSMDPVSKINLVMDMQDNHLLDFEDYLDEKFAYRSKRLEYNKFPNGYYLDDEGILELIDSVTKINNNQIDKFNILFDKTVKRLKYFSCGTWDTFLEDIGAKEVVRLLKSYFLNTYEVYLVKHLHGTNSQLNRFTVQKYLESYYKFLATVDLEPYIFNQSDEDIFGYRIIDNSEYHLSDRYTSLFQSIKNEIKLPDKNKMKRKICDIIKENTVHNIAELNKIMLDMMKTDNKLCERLIK